MCSAPTDLFLGRDNGERDVRRLGENGGVNPKEISSLVRLAPCA
jgi:hypothetical protein